MLNEMTLPQVNGTAGPMTVRRMVGGKVEVIFQNRAGRFCRLELPQCEFNQIDLRAFKIVARKAVGSGMRGEWRELFLAAGMARNFVQARIQSREHVDRELESGEQFLKERMAKMAELLRSENNRREKTVAAELRITHCYSTERALRFA